MNRRMGIQGSAESRSSWRKLNVAIVGVLPAIVFGVVGCKGGGGPFVGEERPEESGVTCDQCLPEIDPTPVNCEAAETGVEFYPAPILSFAGCDLPTEDPDAPGTWIPDSDCRADNTYSYHDGTTSYVTLSDTWKPLASVTTRCQGAGPTHALHLEGGPFTNWGGGLGRNLKCLNGSTRRGVVKVGDDAGPISNLGCDPEDAFQACALFENDAEYEGVLTDYERELLRTACPARDQAMISDGDDADPGSAGEEEFMLGVTLDLSQWDGISFWARRSSNDAEVGIRVSFGDKHTSDDLSFLQYHVNPDDERYCERNVECGCQGNSACSTREIEVWDDATKKVVTQAHTRCWDTPPRPNQDLTLRYDTASGPLDLPNPDAYIVCGDDKCNEEYEAFGMSDAQRAGTTCHEYAFRGGNVESYCYDAENGPYPVERTDQCGDHWVHPVRLSTEWQFYKVPFTSLLQEGWAKESFKLDLTSGAVFRFTWSTGWQDFWVDEVRFYRNLHNTSGDEE